MKHKEIKYLFGLFILTISTSVFAQLPTEIDTTNTWYLSWYDDFDYEDSQLDVNWVSQNGPSGHILCSRWRENAVVGDGILQLVNKKENRGGQEWTSGNIWTKKKFKYGYFECRYRYAAAGATNNSFWLMTQGADPAEGERFEIDINEGHFPNEVNTNIHSHGDVHTTFSKSHVFGITPDVNLPLENPITTKKVRFTSNNNAHFHIREFRIYNDNNRKFPNVMSETADTDVSGLINHARAAGTQITVSGVLREEFEKSRMVDGQVLNTSWVSQKEGQKWIEFEWAEDKTIGCIQFINGWKNGEDWTGLISDYKVEYWNGTQWVSMASLDLASDKTFADVYHTLGLKWNADSIVFYLDGEEIRREVNEFSYSESPIWLSLAIIDWAGEVTDAIDGTSMKVDYVRVYRPKVTAKAANIELDEDNEGTLDASSSTGYDLSYKWIAPANIAISDTKSKVINFTAPTVEKDSTIIFTLEVNDGLQQNSTQVNVLVKNDTNHAVYVPKNNENNKIVVYPNPVHDGLLHIESKSLVREKSTYSIFSMSGTLVQMGLIPGNHSKTTININNVPSGSYMLHITNENSKVASRFIKL